MRRHVGPSVLLLAGLLGAGCEPETANRPPVARAGDDRLVFRGDPVTLDGSGSFDPDEKPFTFAWTMLSGPEPVQGSTGTTLSFTPGVAGHYVFQLTVTDEEDAFASDIASVQVLEVLSVETLSPLDGAIGVAARQPVVAVFDAPIRPWTAAASLTVEDVSDPVNPVPVLGNVTLEDDGTAVVFLPVSDWADTIEYRVTVTQAALGLDGAPLRAPVTSQFFGAAVDVDPPSIIAVSPTDGLVGAPHSTFVEVTFSEPVDALTLGTGSFLVEDGAGPRAGVVSLGAGGTRAIFLPADTSQPVPDPLPLDADTSYLVRVLDTVTDESGNQLDGDLVGGEGGNFASDFRTATGTDTVAPSVLSISPLRGAQGVSVKLPVVVTFSEPVEPSTVAGAIVLTGTSGGGLAGTLTMARGNTVAVFQPTDNLATGAIYQVEVSSTITDLSQNPVPAQFDSFFVTGDAPPPEVLLSVPDRGPIGSSIVVDISGEDFVDGATAFVPGGGVLVNQTTFVSATQLQADLTIAPSAALGARSITVTNPDGQQATGLNLFQILNRPPSVSALSPAAANLGDVAAPIAVLGAEFQNGATVSISGAGVSVDSTTFVNAGQLDLTVSVAGGASTGPRAVTVTNPDGQQVTVPNAFTVRFPAPTVTNISQGSVGQGEGIAGVIVTGTGFLTSPQLPTVNLGSGVLAATVTANATQITINITVSGTATLGLHDVTVTNPDGQTGTLTNGFNVDAAPPTVLSSTPAVSQATTVPVTVNGTGFQCGAGTAPTLAVRRAGAPSTGVTVDNTTFIACNATSFQRNVTVLGTSVVGLHDLRVTNLDGQTRDGANAFQVLEERPVITSLSITQGRRKQTLGVNVNGNFFQSAPTAPVVSFGPGIAVSVDATTPTQIQTTISITDAAALTTRNVVVTNADGQQSNAFNGFTVLKATPDLVTVAPSAGSQGTAPTVTLTGDDFDCTGSPGVVPSVNMGANVTVSGVACPGTGVSENSLTLTATLNAGAGVGLHDVTVTNPDGALDTLGGSFTVREEPPTFGSLTVTSGRRKQTLALTVNGTFFQAGPTVSFGSDIAVSVGTVTATTIAVTLTIADTAALGPRNVVVTNVDGQSVTGTNAFTVNKAPPDLVSLAPIIGSQGTAPTVTLTGDDFDCTLSPGTVPGVNMGANITVSGVTCPGTGVSENSLTLTATLNAGAGVGLHNVTVTNPDGALDTLTGSFTVREEVPTFTSLTVTSGRRKQTVALTINGNFFQASPTVSFGSDIAVSVGAVTATTIAVTLNITDPAVLGPRNVVITNADGQSVTATNAFTVNKAAPDLVSVAPAIGSQGTAFSVTLSGDDFDCTAQPGTVPSVNMGTNVSVSAITCPGSGVSENSLSLTATLNAGAGVGLHDVTVTNPDGALDTLTGSFTVREEAPTFGSLTVTSGRRKQNVALTINGTFFQASPTVSFGSDIAVSVGTVTATTIAVTINIADTASLGPRNVVVTNVDGQSVTGTNAFTVNKAAPDLVSVAPNIGSQGTAFAVVLSGDDFDCTAQPGTVPAVDMGTNVSVSGITCPGSGVSENSLTVTATLNAGAGVGLHDVTVTNPDGALDTLTGSFTVREEAPTFTSLSITSGRRKQTVALTINGTFFQANPTVSFGSDIAVSVGTVTATTIAVSVNIGDPAALGARNVVITNVDGQSVTGTNAFTVNKAAPDVVSIAPNAGSQGTAFGVTISGDDFDCTLSPGTVPGVNLGANVTVSAIACPGIGVSENSLTATATLNAGAGVGAHDVTVTNPDTASDTAIGIFTVREEVPTFTSLSDTDGRRKETVALTITGNFFQANPTVSFGPNIAVSVGTVTATTIDVTLSITPAASLGARNVVITNADGQSVTATNAFTVLKAVPDLVSLSVTQGNQGTTIDVDLNGTDFDCAAAPGTNPSSSFGADITVNSVSCLGSTSDVATQLRANITIGTNDLQLGLHDVSVTNPGGTGGTDNLAGAFLVRQEVPTITSLQDNTGAALPLVSRKSAYSSARLIGNFFQSGATVSMGSDVTISSVTFVSITRLDVSFTVLNSAALGDLGITVTNPDGQFVLNTTAVDVRLPAPSIATVTPPEGNEGEAALAVTITGDDFQCGMFPTASFGAGVVATVNTCSATSLGVSLAISSTAGPGLRTVTVTNSDGQSGAGVGFFEVLLEKPVVSSATVIVSGQPQARRTEAVTVRVIGDFFQAGPSVSFGSGVGILSVTFVNAQTIDVDISVAADPFIAPLGARNVIVTNPDTQQGTLLGGFTILRAIPTIASIVPNIESRQAASFGVTITGDHFDCSASPATVPDADFADGSITVNAESCGGSTSQRASSLTATVAIGSGATLGTHPVRVRNLGPADTFGSTAGLFSVRAEKPTFTSALPNPKQGETRDITITGTFFQSNPPGPSVTIGGGITVNSTTFVTATSLTVNVFVPYTTAVGSYDVTILNPDGQSVLATGGLAVDASAAPTVTAYSPPRAALGETIDITITGTNFQPDTTAVVSGANVTVNPPTTFVSSTTIVANITVDAGAALGNRTITVTNTTAAPPQQAVGPNTFAITDVAPFISTVVPNNGTQGSSVPNVQVNGTDFRAGAVLDFGTGVTVTNVDFVTATQIQVDLSVASGAPPGAHNVTVTNTDTSTYTKTGGFTVVGLGGAPVILSFTKEPVRGATASNVDSRDSMRQSPAGQLFHIGGANFQTGATVTIGGSGVTAGATTLFGTTRLDVTITALCGDTAPGPRDITVKNPDPPSGNGLQTTLIGGLVLRNGVVINEVSTQDQADHGFGAGREAVELFNGSACPIDLSNWRLDFIDTDGVTGYELGFNAGKELYSAGCTRQTFNAGCYAMIDRPDANADNMQNDVYITLFSNTGRFVDDVEIGHNEENDGATDDGAPASGNDGANAGAADEMVARCPNGADTDNDIFDFYQNETAGIGQAATNRTTNNTECQVQCSDGLDNDGDGWVDMLDGGCTNPHTDNAEAGEAATDCNNGNVDSGLDVDVLADEADLDCFDGADNDETQ